MNDTEVPLSWLPQSLRFLLAAQRSAKLRRLRRAFSSRRRLVLSLISVGLAIVWFSNVIVSVMLREPAPQDMLSHWIPIGLMLYGLWHFVKTCFSRPSDSIEWTPAEQELLCAGPFYRYQLIGYRLFGITTATITKAAVFAALMMPDLQQPLAGFVGMVLGLLFLDLLRLIVETVAHGMTARSYSRLRWAVGSIVVAVVVASIVVAFTSPQSWTHGSGLLTLSIVKHLLVSAATLLETPVGQVLIQPFRLFSTVMLTDSFSLGWFTLLAACVIGVSGMAWCVVRLDAYYDVVVAERERDTYSALLAPAGRTQPAHWIQGEPRVWVGDLPADVSGMDTVANPHSIGDEPTGAGQQRAGSTSTQHSFRTATTIGRLAWLGGAGPVAWRQLVGARKQQNTLLVAMAVPGILAILPVWVWNDGREAALNVAAAVTFYSYLLLPTALRFDFRRDINRMVILKSLPIRSFFLVTGQVATPALLALGFQATVLIVSMVIQPYPVWLLVSILILLAQLNFMIFAVDNLLYLFYPYRLNQEGLEIFLRTTLTFTAKGILFACGLGLALAWSIAIRWLFRYVSADWIAPSVVYVLGGSVILTACSLAALRVLARAFDRFDPSQDTPA